MLSEPVFKLVQVTQQYGKFSALTDVNLQIFAGERVALVGSSGAGKSTLIRLLNGTLLPTQGEVWALGQRLNTLSAKQRRQVQRGIGTIYQQFHLVENLRVVHNVNAGQLGRWSFLKALVSLVVPQDLETVIKALTQVGIPEKLYARTDQLSGGQQQRVALARVLVQDPIAILADEPIASLDPELSREVMTLLHRLTVQQDCTLVVSLHAFEVARTYCQRIIGLREGRVLFDAPTSLVTADMVAALYRLPGESPFRGDDQE